MILHRALIVSESLLNNSFVELDNDYISNAMAHYQLIENLEA
jgi:hypothetical protein